MPSLDWQLWFIPLHDIKELPSWYESLIESLYRNSEDVKSLFKNVPFKTAPKFIKTSFYKYKYPNDLHSECKWKRRFLSSIEHY